ncbi:hypothetical protein NVP1244A_131 [Vibrio phage 1.244.A._10N.261.54.C3]|nr:hypothetical protein NVP1244A_131 [Vibrio phage 1.244.A._10N.261.54.C3]AUR98759.1 hypothetical protein NVP1255O_131 [Vibrio phage 1.255.O._10N.286.45.F1]
MSYTDLQQFQSRETVHAGKILAVSGNHISVDNNGTEVQLFKSKNWIAINRPQVGHMYVRIDTDAYSVSMSVEKFNQEYMEMSNEATHK